MYQLKKNHEEILELATEMVSRAAGYLSDVEFSPMDATRTNREYLYRILESVINAGATTVNIPDTVGYTTPEEFYDLISGVFNNVPNIHKAMVSIHCHNDLGLGVANSIAAIRAGARQVECTINGIGERPATPPWKRSSWPSAPGMTCTTSLPASTLPRSIGPAGW